MAGVSVCTVHESTCTNFRMRNNIVAGAAWVGYTVMGYKCGNKNDQTFRNNVGHSVNYKGVGGHGCIIYNPKNAYSCMEGSHFTGYKAVASAIAGGFSNAQKFIFHDMIALDSGAGMGVGISEGGVDTMIEINDNKIYGESEIPDCPPNGGYCYQVEKNGYLAGSTLGGARPIHPPMLIKMPFHKAKGVGGQNGKIIHNRNIYKDFSSSTVTGKRQSLVVSDEGPDFLPANYFYDTQFINMDQAQLAFVKSPVAGWANPSDCGNFPCTAPLNMLFKFYRTIWNNAKTLTEDNLGSEFQVIANNDGFAATLEGCKKVSSWNGYVCHTKHLGQLVFESEDADKEDRSMQPIYVAMDGTRMDNKLNSFMDHCWDGFYTCQKRLSRFISIIHGPPGAVYGITYTGSPAKNQRFTIHSDDPTMGITIRIAYPSAESRNIVKGGTIIPFNAWDEAAKYYGPITQSFCGENRYIGVKNIFEFYLTTGCVLNIAARDAIQTNIRMEWTFAEFFADGGTTKFVDRLAASLGIHKADIKIVSVYEGSLVIIYDIFTALNDPIVLE
jgi:hypothetical protein